MSLQFLVSLMWSNGCEKNVRFLRSCWKCIDLTTKRCIIVSNKHLYLPIGRICHNEWTGKSQDWPIYCMAAGTSWKDSGSRTSTRPGITENPLRRAIPARHKGFFLFYRVRTTSFFGFYGNDIFCRCHIARGHCLLTMPAWTRSKRHIHTTGNTQSYLTSSRSGSSELHAVPSA